MWNSIPVASSRTGDVQRGLRVPVPEHLQTQPRLHRRPGAFPDVRQRRAQGWCPAPTQLPDDPLHLGAADPESRPEPIGRQGIQRHDELHMRELYGDVLQGPQRMGHDQTG